MSKIDKKIKLELSQLFGNFIPYPKKDVKIVDDGGQFRIRLPKNFADAMNIDAAKDYFQFTITVDKDGKRKLVGTLIQE